MTTDQVTGQRHPPEGEAHQKVRGRGQKGGRIREQNEGMCAGDRESDCQDRRSDSGKTQVSKNLKSQKGEPKYA